MDFSEIIESVRGFFDSLPAIAGAILIFILGWIAARLARFLAPRILTLLRFDYICEKTGISGFLKKGNVSHSPSRLFGILLYWFLMILVLSNTVARLDSGASESISLWMASAFPRTMAAGIIVIIGVVVVTFLSNFFITIARNAAIHNPVVIGKGLKTLGFVVVATMALEQLGMGQTIVSTIFLLLCAAAALALALAFGLGCKDIARKYAEDFIRNIREKERLKRGTDLEG
ncbi:MAG: hypothetical protein NT061_01385 [Spirochaetes bacterium]|nr:hypothetical protein [Spirochaetota bacterium]